MDIKDIDEAEALIRKYRVVMKANKSIETINDEQGGASDSFVLTDIETGVDIFLPDLKEETMEAINDVLNSQYDKIVARLKELN